MRAAIARSSSSGVAGSAPASVAGPTAVLRPPPVSWASSTWKADENLAEPHTPARDQIMNRRCAVDFDVPKRGGRAGQAHPLTST